MMRKFILSFFFIISGGLLFGQDLVVTEANDSIYGAITRVSEEYLSITTRRGQNLVLKQTNVKDYQYGFYEVSGNSETPSQDRGNRGVKTFAWQQLRIAISGGYSYRLAAIPKGVYGQEKNYYKSLKSGFHFGADFSYFFHRIWGVGLSYAGSYYNSTDLLFLDKESNTLYRGHDKIFLQQIMPTIGIRAVNKKNPNNFFLFTMGMGYVGYKDKTYLNDIHVITIKGGTFAMITRIGYDISVAKNLAIVVQASLTGGVLKKAVWINKLTGERQTEKSDTGEGLGRIDLSLGFRFGK